MYSSKGTGLVLGRKLNVPEAGAPSHAPTSFALVREEDSAMMRTEFSSWADM